MSPARYRRPKQMKSPKACVCVRVCVTAHCMCAANVVIATPFTGSRTGGWRDDPPCRFRSHLWCFCNRARSFSSINILPLPGDNSEYQMTPAFVNWQPKDGVYCLSSSLLQGIRRTRRPYRDAQDTHADLLYRSTAINAVSPPAGSGAAVKNCMTHCSISLPACPGLSIIVSAGCCVWLSFFFHNGDNNKANCMGSTESAYIHALKCSPRHIHD